MRGGSTGRSFLKPFFPIRETVFKVSAQIFVIILRDIIGLEKFYCPSANHNPELQCVICNGVTLFTLVLDLNCIALSQSESSIMYIISSINSFYYT